MISRRTARILAETVAHSFRKYHPRTAYQPGHHTPNSQAIYEFLYDHGYAAWFCNLGKGIYSSSNTGPTKDFVMKIHTGETLAPATNGWDWPAREKLGQRYLADLAEDILQKFAADPPQYSSDLTKLLDQLTGALELDGYLWDGSRLRHPEDDAVDAHEEAGVVQSLYRELGLAEEETTFHHLKLSEEHYLAGKWDDSISNSRKFLESTLQQTASRHSSDRESLDVETLSKPVRVRDYLEREGLLEPKEKQAVASIYGLLSETGGHPYVAEKDQARLMRHLALTFAQFVLLRLRGSLKGAN